MENNLMNNEAAMNNVEQVVEDSIKVVKTLNLTPMQALVCGATAFILGGLTEKYAIDPGFKWVKGKIDAHNQKKGVSKPIENEAEFVEVEEAGDEDTND